MSDLCVSLSPRVKEGEGKKRRHVVKRKGIQSNEAKQEKAN